MKRTRHSGAGGPSRRPSEDRRHRGAALVLTLLVVSMLTILVVAYFVTMRVEQQAAHAYADSQRAKMIAQGAVGHGISLLRTQIPEPARINESAANAPAENWAVNPGRLTRFDDTGRIDHVPLHTGEAEVSPEETMDPDVHSVDLNEPLPGKRYPAIAMALKPDGSPDFEAEPPAMRVKWVPVLENPGEEASPDNPITGRYAFWIDDESARINFNTALGKPARGEHDPQRFWEQYRLGLMTPLFTEGRGDVEYNQNSSDREWALGKLRSVNLDVLFDHPGELDSDGLLGHAWLRGFSRYPEAILEFVRLEGEERERWYHGNKFNLTFYSRSPEFNAFGRPRLFTTNIPLSLEAGPLYQLPFVYNGPDVPEPSYDISGVLHLNSLMGSLGFTHVINDGREEGNVHAANLVNRAQLEMLARYLKRPWPGYGSASFEDKYGRLECYQMALSMLTMARMATTTMATGGRRSSRDWAWRTTSVIYSPHQRERPGANPERHYWQIPLDENAKPTDENVETVPMLPQMPGPHIAEVRLIFQSVHPRRGPSGPTKRWIGFRYEVEYYHHGMAPMTWLNEFPAKVDYLRMDIGGGNDRMPPFYELGPPTAEAGRGRPDRDWNFNRWKRIPNPSPTNPNRTRRVADRLSLGGLRASAGGRVRISCPESSEKNARHRIIVSSPMRFLGTDSRWLANPGDPRPAANDMPVVIDLLTHRQVSIDVKWRLGMGVRPDQRRPRQMIPIGETPEDVLEARFDLDLRGGEQQVVSWQINDPRLSWHRDEWIRDDEDGGTPGLLNEVKSGPLEPEEEASEKSKFRYFQRGPGRVKLEDSQRSFPLNRPDEYNSRSRVSSKGYWSVLHTGIQNRRPWQTLDLGGGSTGGDDPPDYLLLDLLGATYPMQHDQWKINSTLPDEFSTVSFMHSTAGQVNLNSRIYPDGSPWFQPPPRRRPIEAVFKHLRSDSELETLLDAVEDYQRSDFFRDIGDVTRLNGYRRGDRDATQFEHEELLRHMAGCLTTRSNTFGIWGAAQVVKKARGHLKWGEFEDGDRVLGEKRFYAVVERYLWPGKDGVPGNAHVDARGVWDRLAREVASTNPKLRPPDVWDGSNTDTLFRLPGSPPVFLPNGSRRLQLDWRGTYPEFDGPQRVEMDRYASRSLGKVVWRPSTLEDAYNPPQPVIKYRVVYFKYLDE